MRGGGYNYYYYYYRDIPELIGELGEVLNEPNKAVLFHYICQLLPHEAQAEFDRIAAASLEQGKIYCDTGLRNDRY